MVHTTVSARSFRSPRESAVYWGLRGLGKGVSKTPVIPGGVKSPGITRGSAASQLVRYGRTLQGLGKAPTVVPLPGGSKAAGLTRGTAARELAMYGRTLQGLGRVRRRRGIGDSSNPFGFNLLNPFGIPATAPTNAASSAGSPGSGSPFNETMDMFGVSDIGSSPSPIDSLFSAPQSSNVIQALFSDVGISPSPTPNPTVAAAGNSGSASGNNSGSNTGANNNLQVNLLAGSLLAVAPWIIGGVVVISLLGGRR